MKIVLWLLAFIFITGAIFVGVRLTRKEDPAAVQKYIESRGKTPPPPSIRDEIGRGI